MFKLDLVKEPEQGIEAEKLHIILLMPKDNVSRLLSILSPHFEESDLPIAKPSITISSARAHAVSMRIGMLE